MASGTLSFEAQLERIATRPVVDPVADLAVLREALVQRDGRVRHTDLLQFAEIVASLLRQVPLIQRMAFANRVAAIPIVPRPLLRQIILDHYLVSAPVLERAPMLDESDILQAMAERGDEVMLAIAKRREISLRITDVLMAQGGRKVMLALAENASARISPRNLALLAGQARAQPDLEAALARRADLPEAVAASLSQRLGIEIKPAPAADAATRKRVGVVLDSDFQTAVKRTRKEPKILRYS